VETFFYGGFFLPELVVVVYLFDKFFGLPFSEVTFFVSSGPVNGVDISHGSVESVVKFIVSEVHPGLV